jgi:hypothetical protein
MAPLPRSEQVPGTLILNLLDLIGAGNVEKLGMFDKTGPAKSRRVRRITKQHRTESNKL